MKFKYHDLNIITFENGEELEIIPFCSKEVNEYEQKIKEAENKNTNTEAWKIPYVLLCWQLL